MCRTFRAIVRLSGGRVPDDARAARARACAWPTPRRRRPRRRIPRLLGRHVQHASQYRRRRPGGGVAGAAARANLLLVQVRRRGDAWYLNALEPPPDGVALARTSIRCRNHRPGACRRRPGPRLRRRRRHLAPDDAANEPESRVQSARPDAGGAAQPGRANWLTRTQQPDGNGTSYGGHRFGTDFWIDPGHPDAAAYTADVIARLVRNYDIDGLHLDRLQYPDFGRRRRWRRQRRLQRHEPGALSAPLRIARRLRARSRRAVVDRLAPRSGDRAHAPHLPRRPSPPNARWWSRQRYAGGKPPETDEGWGVSEPARAFSRIGAPGSTRASSTSRCRWSIARNTPPRAPRASLAGAPGSRPRFRASCRRRRRRLPQFGRGHASAVAPRTSRAAPIRSRGRAVLDGGAQRAGQPESAGADPARHAVSRLRGSRVGARTGRTVSGQPLELGAGSLPPSFSAFRLAAVSPCCTSLRRDRPSDGIVTSDRRPPLDCGDWSFRDRDARRRVTTDGSGFFGARRLRARVSSASAVAAARVAIRPRRRADCR